MTLDLDKVKNDEPKPLKCPFCQSEWIEITNWEQVKFVRCCNCGAEGPAKRTWKAAIAAWNTAWRKGVEERRARFRDTEWAERTIKNALERELEK